MNALTFAYVVNRTVDPEIGSGCLDLITTMIPYYSPAFLDASGQESLKASCEHALICLSTSEPMPKRSAARFWVC